MSPSALRIALLSALFALPFVLRAQDAARPAVRQELWTSIGLQGRPSFLEDWLGKSTVKRIKTTGEIGYRSADSFFAGRQYYFDLGADYKVSDHITVGSEFRYAIRTGDDDRQRLGGKVQYETELGRATIAYRMTYQHNFRDFGEVREVFRHKVIAKYNFGDWKFDPEFSAEFFTWAGYQGLTYYGTRYKLGTEYDFSKAHAIGVSIVHDRERMVYAPEYRFILAIDYGIKLYKL
ncbi:MAG: DUF2490 domain-containing protein [Flavobacteriales bacterium]